MEVNEVYIYTLSDPRDGLIKYVGRTKNMKERLKNHCNPARYKNTYKFNWIKELRDLGLKPVIEEIDREHKDDYFLEKYWAHQLKAWGFDLLNYGIVTDGISMGNNTSFEKGHKKTLGRKHKQSTKDKLREIMIKRSFSPPNKKSVICRKLNGEFLKTYDSLHSAARDTGSNVSKISACCRGKRRSHNKLKWSYNEV